MVDEGLESCSQYLLQRLKGRPQMESAARLLVQLAVCTISIMMVLVWWEPGGT
jgi:hypothetical protein